MSSLSSYGNYFIFSSWSLGENIGSFTLMNGSNIMYSILTQAENETISFITGSYLISPTEYIIAHSSLNLKFSTQLDNTDFKLIINGTQSEWILMIENGTVQWETGVSFEKQHSEYHWSIFKYHNHKVYMVLSHYLIWSITGSNQFI